MKKLSLKPNTFDKGEVLTRAQLKKVMGGTGSEICGPEEYDTPTTWYCCNTGVKYENQTCRQVVTYCTGLITNDFDRC